METYLGLEDASRMLGISTRTLTRWAKVGRIPYAKLNDSPNAAFLFRYSDIKNLVESRMQMKGPVRG